MDDKFIHMILVSDSYCKEGGRCVITFVYGKRRKVRIFVVDWTRKNMILLQVTFLKKVN